MSNEDSNPTLAGEQSHSAPLTNLSSSPVEDASANVNGSVVSDDAVVASSTKRNSEDSLSALEAKTSCEE